MIDLGLAPRYFLEPNSLLTAKELEKMTGVKANRIHYFAEAGILIPAEKMQKGDGILTYSYYDCVNCLEVFLINKLTAFFIPKRLIKEFFESIREIRNSLNPFNIADHKRGTFLTFFFDVDGKLCFEFKQEYSNKDAVSLVVNLKQLVSDLFERVDALP